ncbi:hypothetical protein J6590_043532 [Homalodisca vitripennis]|nr:hypothetical protein J6590_043532 [Homalodisca vitripennis]
MLFFKVLANVKRHINLCTVVPVHQSATRWQSEVFGPAGSSSARRQMSQLRTSTQPNATKFCTGIQVTFKVATKNCFSVTLVDPTALAAWTFNDLEIATETGRSLNDHHLSKNSWNVV